jgi:hypothetical protein
MKQNITQPVRDEFNAHLYPDPSINPNPSFKVGFKKFPRLTSEILKTTYKGILSSLKAIIGASAKRYFHLEDHWEIMIEVVNSEKYQDNDVTGVIVIPSNAEVPTRFDGASIPLPWFVSFLTFGILRPLGVLLIASIVHDFAFQHGYLYYREDNGGKKQYHIPRHIADQLFYDIIKTVNNMPITASLAHFAVRIGWWFGVKYNGQFGGGKKPIKELILLIFFLIILSFVLANLLSFFNIETIVFYFSIIYFLIFILLEISRFIYHKLNKNNA